jgi:6-pyruvoyltetrahydropterin/6-carboxytetrahydropterin synthase
MREIRCLLSPTNIESARHPTNSWAGTSTVSTSGPFYTISAVVEGKVDPATGYVCNINAIDDLLRAEVAPLLAIAASRGHRPLSDTATALRRSFVLAREHVPSGASLEELCLRVSPFTRLTIIDGDDFVVRLTQSFEFSASHRLYRRELSDAENLRLFGKCSNPSGHGHNYVVEVTVGGWPSSTAGTVMDIGALDGYVKAYVLDYFDHKNLNLECAEFATLNPTVENIALVIWNRLFGRMGRLSKLISVRVWETPKTYAEYRGEPQ